MACERKKMSFEDWVGRVSSEIASDIHPQSYRQYYDAGLSPAEAVARERRDAGLEESQVSGPGMV